MRALGRRICTNQDESDRETLEYAVQPNFRWWSLPKAMAASPMLQVDICAAVLVLKLVVLTH